MAYDRGGASMQHLLALAAKAHAEVAMLDHRMAVIMGASVACACSRPFCPKLEIQHNRRGRGVPTLTIRREEKMVL
jgi:hypothetical protein